MAELVLSGVGAAAGARLLPGGLSVLGARIGGAAVGRTLGSLAGAAIDAALAPVEVRGPRIRDFHVTESREGAGIPVVYGRMRVGGQVIWSAPPQEVVRRTGGKGGPRTAERSLTASFAVGLCEGEAARIARAWADGAPLDLSRVTHRFYPGSETQGPDPLIEAVEGAGAAPAYRGLAYVVFEAFPLAATGGRLPQFSFEVVRPAGRAADRLEAVVKAVNLIPGAGEFALATDVVRRRTGPGAETPENQHGAEARADLLNSLDQLQADLPGVTRVNLVVGWFGDDLRCGVCRIRPGVEVSAKETRPWGWSVGPVGRPQAHLISATEGRANYGGTPADRAVVQAIRELRARGLHVTLYPFLLMDVPPGNGRPDPHGGAGQAAFPWRGRITCDPAPGAPGSVQGTAGAADQVAAFFGTAGAAQFTVSGETVGYTGPAEDGYRRFIHHCAALAEAAGGVDGFLVGSEMVGLTRLRDGAGGRPAVEALRVLAGEVKARLGAGTEVSYAADWTEYGAEADGADLGFPLDPLWADPAVDYVGLDWYAPMGDWRDGAGQLDAGYGSGDAPAYLAASMAGGEAFDWYYADPAGRAAQARLPITDGVHGEPWVYRQKAVADWWANAHHVRSGGVRSPTPTAWTPAMKPVRFVEMGCPAVDKGANQPNVFYDPKSSESALPHFSDGSRDDLVQRRAVEAFHRHFAPGAAGNPVSPVYGGPMVPHDGVAVWAWDARPYPAFPARTDVWGDGDNWRLGHWLNGRAGAALLADVVGDIARRAGVEADAGEIDGVTAGYRFDGPAAAREALAPLLQMYGLGAAEREGVVVFRRADPAPVALAGGDLVLTDDGSDPLALRRAGMEEPVRGVRLGFTDIEADHLPGVAASREVVDGAPDVRDVEAALAMDRDEAGRRADALAAELAAGRERVAFALGPQGSGLEPGDVVELSGRRWRITELGDGGTIDIEAVRVSDRLDAGLAPMRAGPVARERFAPARAEPEVVIVDAPPLPGEEDDARPLVFIRAAPWTGAVTLWAGRSAEELTVRAVATAPAPVGRLVTPLAPGEAGRWRTDVVEIELAGWALASRSRAAVLNGANAFLIETPAGWEIAQFAEAELVAADRWRLAGALRGAQGSEAEALAGAAAGALILPLEAERVRLALRADERDAPLVWRAGWGAPGDPEAASGVFTWRARGLRAWSPAHLRARCIGGDVRLDWVRRARRGGDGWDEGEPPLEPPELHRIAVLDGGAVARRSWETAEPRLVYTAAEIATDFPAGGAAVAEVRQLGPDGRFGAPTRIDIAL